LEIEEIVAELKKERDRLNQAITALEGLSPRAAAKRRAVPNRVTRGKKRRGGLTPEGRKRLSELMKKRWAERRNKRSKGR
jgi:Spy/CpxP family protein refolding chaperone